MLLSIIVPTVHTRYDSFRLKLERELYHQYDALQIADQKKVEIIVFSDTKSFVLGKKRDMLYKLSQGEYTVQLDDDDRVADDYIKRILVALKTKPDVVSYDMRIGEAQAGTVKRTRVSIKHLADRNTRDEYLRIPSYQMVIKTSLARKVGEIDKSFGEDTEFSKKLLPMLKKEHKIEDILYYYDFDASTSETQRVDTKPIVDVVFLSKATDKEDIEQCQKAIDTCREGARRKINIIVIEQNPKVSYNDVDELIHKPGKFNYNSFANFGAAKGKCEWIMIANSDLIFEDNWLEPLLATKSDLVSPHNPEDHRQMFLDKVESGTINGRHLSGWCFMIKRHIWDKMGRFDDIVEFWCSDDVVIEQAVALGVTPTVVRASIVRHLGSKTMNKSDDVETLKWKSIYIFNKKYSRAKSADDIKYVYWVMNHPKEVREADAKFK